ncbi:MAG: tetratricopeptide repeat protein [Elusimicrobia bacterium]|nr:tetratricopeptide repeat protein [Elusimicrobiota bacterium]
MDADQIQQAKVLKDAGMYFEAAQFYQKIIRSNPTDKSARLGYAQCLIKQGLKEKLNSLLEKAKKILFELIEDDYGFFAAHDELIFLHHHLNQLGNLSKFYNEKLRLFPQREIYRQCIKKISTVSLLAIPTENKKESWGMSFFMRLFIHFVIVSVSVIFVLSLTVKKFRSLVFPSALFIFLFIGWSVFRFLAKPKKRDKW